MQSVRVVERSRSRWRGALSGALLVVCGAAASCKHDADRVAGFLAAFDQLAEARCRCEADMSECFEDEILDGECEQRVVRKHQDAIEDWLVCVTRAARDATACVKEAECSALGRGACELDLEDACGEPPKEASDAIEDELDRACLEPIGCDDGQVVQGNFCNGQVECEDASDELFCDDDGSSSGSGSAGGTPDPGGMVPIVTPPPPALMPPPPVDAVQACITTSPVPPAFDGSCLQCVCEANPMTALSCDGLCWALIECVLDFCPDAPPGSQEQTSCAIESCQMSLGGAATATQVGATIRNDCAGVCPPF